MHTINLPYKQGYVTPVPAAVVVNTYEFREAEDPSILYYRTRAIIARSRSETALEYKPRILGLKYEEFLFLVHKVVCNINRTSI